MAHIYINTSNNYTTFNSTWDLLRELILPDQETFDFLKSPLVISLVSILIIAISAIHHFYTRSWGAVKYKVAVPEECDEQWHGEVLKELDIKVG